MGTLYLLFCHLICHLIRTNPSSTFHTQSLMNYLVTRSRTLTTNFRISVVFLYRFKETLLLFTKMIHFLIVCQLCNISYLTHYPKSLHFSMFPFLCKNHIFHNSYWFTWACYRFFLTKHQILTICKKPIMFLMIYFSTNQMNN